MSCLWVCSVGGGDLLWSVFVNSSYIKNFVPFWVEVNKRSKIFFYVYYQPAKFCFFGQGICPWSDLKLLLSCLFFKPTRWLAEVFLKLSWLALFKECIWILASYYIYVLVLLNKSCLELCHLSCVSLCTFTLCHPLNSDTRTPPTQQQRNTPVYMGIFQKKPMSFTQSRYGRECNHEVNAMRLTKQTFTAAQNRKPDARMLQFVIVCQLPSSGRIITGFWATWFCNFRANCSNLTRF